jgi:uncharacterized protein (DUF1778 family)
MNKTNASAYFSEAQLDQVTRAANAAGKSVSQYIRDIVGEWAASDLKERPAAPPTARPPAPESAVVRAARLRGMSVTDYRRYGAEMQAREELGLPKLDPYVRAPGRMTIVPPAPTASKAKAKSKPPRALPRRTASGTFQRRAG